MATLIVNSAPGDARPIVDVIRAARPWGEIWVVDHYPREALGDKFDRYWSVQDLTFARYAPDEVNRCPALDGAALADLAEIESVFVKMLEKNEKFNKLNAAVRNNLVAWSYEGFPDLGHDYNARKANFIDHVRVWSHYIQHEVDEVVVSAIPNHGYDYVIYQLCQKFGKRFMTFDQLPIPGRLLPRMLMELDRQQGAQP